MMIPHPPYVVGLAVDWLYYQGSGIFSGLKVYRAGKATTRIRSIKTAWFLREYKIIANDRKQAPDTPRLIH